MIEGSPSVEYPLKYAESSDRGAHPSNFNDEFSKYSQEIPKPKRQCF